MSEISKTSLISLSVLKAINKSNVDMWSLTTRSLYFPKGLRLLDERVTREIMEVVRDVMEDKGVNPFLFERENAHILSGEEEALFAWLTINYLEEIFHENR